MKENTINILAISGTERKGSHTRRLVYCAKKFFDIEGVSFTIFDLKETPLPMYDEEEETQKNPHVQQFLKLVTEADAFVLSSPEYHNSMAGAMKNALDWFNALHKKMKGRLFGLMGGGGSFANTGASLQMTMAIRSVHGWLMPDVVVGVPKIFAAFDDEGMLKDPMLMKRLEEFAHKMIQYTRMFKENREMFK